MSYPLEPVSITLCGKEKDFVDVIILRWSPKCNHMYYIFISGRKREIHHKQKRRVQCDRRSLDWSDVNTSQVMMAVTRIQKQ